MRTRSVIFSLTVRIGRDGGHGCRTRKLGFVKTFLGRRNGCLQRTRCEIKAFCRCVFTLSLTSGCMSLGRLHILQRTVRTSSLSCISLSMWRGPPGLLESEVFSASSSVSHESQFPATTTDERSPQRRIHSLHPFRRAWKRPASGSPKSLHPTSPKHQTPRRSGFNDNTDEEKSVVASSS